MKTLVCAALGTLFAALSTSSHAAALDGARTLPHGAAAIILQAADRPCTSRQGGRHCRNATPRRTPEAIQSGYGYAYGTPKAEFYPTGSSAWWRAMEREGRTGQTPD
jgi:hypothetical protein